MHRINKGVIDKLLEIGFFNCPHSVQKTTTKNDQKDKSRPTSCPVLVKKTVNQQASVSGGLKTGAWIMQEGKTTEQGTNEQETINIQTPHCSSTVSPVLTGTEVADVVKQDVVHIAAKLSV